MKQCTFCGSSALLVYEQAVKMEGADYTQTRCTCQNCKRDYVICFAEVTNKNNHKDRLSPLYGRKVEK